MLQTIYTVTNPKTGYKHMTTNTALVAAFSEAGYRVTAKTGEY